MQRRTLYQLHVARAAGDPLTADETARLDQSDQQRAQALMEVVGLMPPQESARLFVGVQPDDQYDPDVAFRALVLRRAMRAPSTERLKIIRALLELRDVERVELAESFGHGRRRRTKGSTTTNAERRPTIERRDDAIRRRAAAMVTIVSTSEKARILKQTYRPAHSLSLRQLRRILTAHH